MDLHNVYLECHPFDGLVRPALITGPMRRAAPCGLHQQQQHNISVPLSKAGPVEAVAAYGDHDLATLKGAEANGIFDA